MKITSVEVFVLKSPGLYNNPEGAEEPLGPTYMGVVRVSTDAGITGYSDMETVRPVAKACVDAPRWSGTGHGVLRWPRFAADRRESAGGRAALVQDVSRQHLLRPARRCDPGDLRDRHRAVGHLRQVLPAAGPHPAGRQVARQSARLCQHVVPSHAGGHARSRRRRTSTRASPPSNSAGECSAKTRAGRRLVEAAREEMGAGVDLLVDTGWFVERTPKQAIQVVRSIEPFAPFFVEELLHPEDYDGYRKVAEAWRRSSRAASRKPPSGAFSN